MDEENIILIEQAKGGDSHAFSLLYSIYAEELYRFALYMTANDYEAEDAVQDAVVSAWQNLHKLKENEKFKVWIFKILANKCKTLMKKKSKNINSLPIDEYDFLCDEEDFTVTAELKAALKSLTPPDGQIIVMSVIGGFTSDEIAAVFGMNSSTVRSRQRRGLEKLREILK